MTAPQEPADVPALALPVDRAAAALGLSENHFRRHVLPQVRSIRVGKAHIVPVIELERWLSSTGTSPTTEVARDAPRKRGIA